MNSLSRRTVLRTLGAAALAPAAALARPEDVVYAMRQVVGNLDTTPGRVLLDLPGHAENGISVPMVVGLAQPVRPEDLPCTIHVFGDGNPRPRVLAATFSALSGPPELATRIRLDGAQTVTAIAQMPDKTWWRTDRKLTVTFGACAEIGRAESGSDFQVESRISFPQRVARGDVVPVRTLISHPMETGFRLNNFNEWIPLHIIDSFTCAYNGREVLKVRLEPAIATNPYLAFNLVAAESGTLDFTWVDSDGSIYENAGEIAVI